MAAPTNGTLGSLVDDADPIWDVCSEEEDTVALTGRNVGDLLTAAEIPWAGSWAASRCGQTGPARAAIPGSLTISRSGSIPRTTDRLQQPIQRSVCSRSNSLALCGDVVVGLAVPDQGRSATAEVLPAQDDDVLRVELDQARLPPQALCSGFCNQLHGPRTALA